MCVHTIHLIRHALPFFHFELIRLLCTHFFNEYVFDKHYMPNAMLDIGDMGGNKINQESGPWKA